MLLQVWLPYHREQVAIREIESAGIHIEDDIVAMMLSRQFFSEELVAVARGSHIPFEEWDDLIRVLKTSRLDNASNDSQSVGEIRIVYQDTETLAVQVLPEDKLILFKVGNSLFRPIDSDLSWFNQFVERVEKGHH